MKIIEMPTGSSKTAYLVKIKKKYQDFLKLIKIWRKFADLHKGNKGPTIDLSLVNEALDAVRDSRKKVF